MTTKPIDLGDLETGKIKAVTVGLKEGEVGALEKIVAALGLDSRNSLMRYIIRRFLDDYQAGRVDIEVEEKTTKTPRLP